MPPLRPTPGRQLRRNGHYRRRPLVAEGMVELRIPQLVCTDCGRSVPFAHPLLPPRRRLWLDLDQRLTELYLEGASYRGAKRILERAADTDLGLMTLWRRLQAVAEGEHAAPGRPPASVVGLDEVHQRLRGEARWLLCARARDRTGRALGGRGALGEPGAGGRGGGAGPVGQADRRFAVQARVCTEVVEEPGLLPTAPRYRTATRAASSPTTPRVMLPPRVGHRVLRHQPAFGNTSHQETRAVDGRRTRVLPLRRDEHCVTPFHGGGRVPRPVHPDSDRPPLLPRRVAHFDLDSFFVAVERARNPDLRGRPVLVGYPGSRGVVSTASYEARRYGCRSAQPMVQAMRLCPHAIVVPPDHAAYREVSERFHAMLRELSPIVESVGIDEAYAELTGLRDPRIVAESLRRRVREELHVTVSVCIAGSKTTAKVGSDRAKPDGLIEVPVGQDAAFLAPLPVRELPLVGPRLGEALAAAGVRTIGQAAALDRRWLAEQFGRSGEALWDRANGIDPTPVHAGGRDQRQISREVTFAEDVRNLAELRRVLQRHAEQVGSDLRRTGRRARTVVLKLRWSDFETLTRSRTLAGPFQSTPAIRDAAAALLEEVRTLPQAQPRDQGDIRPVRLIGVGVTNLVEDAVQLDLTSAATGHRVLRDEQLDRLVDRLRQRFGDDSVQRGLRA